MKKRVGFNTHTHSSSYVWLPGRRGREGGGLNDVRIFLICKFSFIQQRNKEENFCRKRSCQSYVFKQTHTHAHLPPNKYTCIQTSSACVCEGKILARILIIEIILAQQTYVLLYANKTQLIIHEYIHNS